MHMNIDNNLEHDKMLVHRYVSKVFTGNIPVHDHKLVTVGNMLLLLVVLGYLVYACVFGCV